MIKAGNAGGTLSVVAGALPAGLALPAIFTGAGDIADGTSTATINP